MTCYIYDKAGINQIRTEQKEPRCGVDFCDQCGDCLACYGGELCYNSGEPTEHFWVQYGDWPLRGAASDEH